MENKLKLGKIEGKIHVNIVSEVSSLPPNFQTDTPQIDSQIPDSTTSTPDNKALIIARDLELEKNVV